MSENRKRNFKLEALPPRRSQRLLGHSPAVIEPIERDARGPTSKRVKTSEGNSSATIQPTEDMPGTSHGSGHGHALADEQGGGIFQRSSEDERTEGDTIHDRDFWFKCTNWSHTTRSCWFIPKIPFKSNDGSKFEERMNMLAKLEEKRLKKEQPQTQDDQQNQGQQE